MGCVYVLTSPNGKQYVGLTSTSFRRRWRGHLQAAKHGAKNPLYCAFRKHDATKFKREVVFESDDRDELAAKEIELIKALGTLAPRGYNLTTGGERGFTMAEGPRKLISQRRRERWEKLSDEEREVERERARSVMRDPDARARMTATRRAKSTPVLVAGVLFRHIRDAQEATGLSYTGIWDRVRAGEDGWAYQPDATSGFADPRAKLDVGPRRNAPTWRAVLRGESHDAKTLAASLGITKAALEYRCKSPHWPEYAFERLHEPVTSSEWRARLREAARRKSRPIVLNGVAYRSIPDAADLTGFTRALIVGRLRSANYPDCYYAQ